MSVIKVDTIQNTSGAEVYTAKAWCYLNGVSNTVLNSGNISSVTDTAVGEPQFNFSSTMSNANYGVTCHIMQSAEGNTQGGGYLDGLYVNTRNTTNLLVNTVNDSSSTSASTDCAQVDIQVTL